MSALLVHDFDRFMESPVMKQGYAASKAAEAAREKAAAAPKTNGNGTA
jgi:hypothetical protein